MRSKNDYNISLVGAELRLEHQIDDCRFLAMIWLLRSDLENVFNNGAGGGLVYAEGGSSFVCSIAMRLEGVGASIVLKARDVPLLCSREAIVVREINMGATSVTQSVASITTWSSIDNCQSVEIWSTSDCRHLPSLSS